MQLDLEEVSQLLRDDEMFLVLMQIDILPILTQVDGMPTVRFLEAREAHIRQSQLFGSEEAFEGLREPICKTLDGGGRHMFASTPFERGIESVLAWEGAILPY